MTRCSRCWNLAPFCNCRTAPSPPAEPEKTDYEKALERLRLNMHGRKLFTATEMVTDALGGDPSQDGLYLCKRGCGVTVDPECSYGGHHGLRDYLTVDYVGDWP